MKIILVNPPYPKASHQHPPFIPLSLGYLGAVCEKAGYDVNVIDCQAEFIGFSDFEKILKKKTFDLVGVTSTTLTYNSALRIVSIAKKVNPSSIAVLGGCHVTFWDENALKECSSLDIIVKREGEQTFLELVQKLEKKGDLKNVKGITFRNSKGKIIQNEDRAFIEDLDELPFPAHHLLPLKSFKRGGKVIFPVTTSRGCVYWCDFCTSVRMFGRQYRMRSPKNVVDELEFLVRKYGAKQFTFYDDAFTVDTKRTEKICEEIRRRKLEIQWDCETRVDMVNENLLKKMKAAGCMAVWFGVESGSQQIIEKMHKGLKIEQTRKAFKMVQDLGLMNIAGVVLGFPGETEKTAWETINFIIKEVKPTDVGFYVATPYPGTPMYELVKEKGWLKVTDFDKYDTATPIFETPFLSSEKLMDIRYKAHQKFYLRPTHVIRMFGKGRIYGISALKTSLAYLLRALHIRIS